MIENARNIHSGTFHLVNRISGFIWANDHTINTAIATENNWQIKNDTECNQNNQL